MILRTIKTQRFNIRSILPTDNLSTYLTWMTSPETYPFIESASKNFSELQLIKYLETTLSSPNTLQGGIYTLTNDLHVGNIKFHDINLNERSSLVGFLIGDKDWQGRGVAKEVFLACSHHLNQEYGISIFRLGVHKNHEHAIRSYSNMGFRSESTSKHGDTHIIRMIYQFQSIP